MSRLIVLLSIFTMMSVVAGGELFSSGFSAADALKQWTNLSEYQQEKRIAFTPGGMTLDALSRTAPNEHYCSFAPRHLSLPDSYVAELESTFAEARGDAHYGLKVNGVQIVIRRNIWAVGNVAAVRDPAHFSDGQNRTPVVFRVINTPAKVMVFANGRNVLEITKKNAGENAVSLYLYNVKATFSRFRIFSSESTELSPNLVRNSGFEIISGTLPEYWGIPWWGLVHESWALQPEKFRKHFGIDSQQAYEGKNSFRIDLPSAEDKRSFELCSTYLYLKPGKTYTVSAWLKASKAALPVLLSMRSEEEARHLVTVGTQWQRYSFTFVQKQPQSQLIILPEAPGTLWIDAVQIEESRTASVYAKHMAETISANKLSAPPASALRIDKIPVLDGVLEPEIWNNASPLKLAFRTDGTTPKQKTEARILCDRENLYIAVECFDPDVKNLKATIRQPKGPVWEDDAVEIFLKPTPNSSMYYQFVVNSLNTTYEGLTYADSVWRGQWKTAVRKYDDRWVVEAAIPLSNMTSMASDGEIGFMIGRDNPKIGEHSASAPVKGFMEYRHFGTLALPLPSIGKVSASKNEKNEEKKTELVREFSVFTGEKTMRFRLFDAKPGMTPLQAELFKNGQAVASRKFNSPDLDFDNRFGTGDFELRVKTASGLDFRDTFKVATPFPYESKVNYWNRSIVSDGKDFYMFGICLEMREISDQMAKFLTENGFNTIEFSGWYPDGSPYPEEKIRQSFDNGHKYGAKVVNTFQPHGDKVYGIIEFNKRIAPHPAQLMAYMFDEYSFKGFSPEVFTKIDQEFKRLHKEVGYRYATFQNEYDLGVIRDFNFKNADIVSLDHYPVPMRDISSTSLLLKKLNQIAGRRPINLFTQICGNAYFTPRLPTIQEVVNQYYQGMSLDCWNFIAFANIPLEPKIFTTLKQLRSERDTLLEAGVSTGIDLPVECSSDNIQFLARRTATGDYIIAVNLIEKTVPAQFSGLQEGKAEELFSDQRLELRNGQIQTPFAPLERRVFRIAR